MKPGYLDADVILRYLTGDPPEMAEAAAALLERAEARAQEGEASLTLTEITLAEVVWVLQRFYGFKKDRIAQVLLSFLEIRGLRVPDKGRLQHALCLYRDLNLGFGDALLAAQALSSGPAVVYAFDRHFRRVEGLEHLPPS